MPALEIREVTSVEELERLRPAWIELWARSPRATPFQSPAWLIPWWRHIGRGELMALAVYYGGSLVGLLPLYIYDEPPLKKLLPVGIGNSDYLDALVEQRCAEECASTMLRHLAQSARCWDVCDLQPLSPESPLLETAAPPTLLDQCSAQEPCPVLPLPSDVTALHVGLPRRMRQNLRYCRRRAENAAELRYESAGPDNLAELLDAFFVLHGARWTSRGGPGVLADPAVRAFHGESAPALLDLGILRCYAMRLDGRIGAVYYGFNAKRRAYYYLSGFDPGLAQLSPGTLIVGHAIEEALRESATEFDFLRGREDYKYRWGAKERPTYGRRLTHAII